MFSRGNIGVNDIIGVNANPNPSLYKLYRHIAILIILYDYTIIFSKYKVIIMNRIFDEFLTNIYSHKSFKHLQYQDFHANIH